MAHGLVRALVLAGALGLAACGSPTPYQPAVDGFGYAEQSLEPNRFRVTFAGNSLTDRETVENYLLYRAAEITVQSGHDHFVIVDADTERSTTYHSTTSDLGGHYGVGRFRHRHPYGVGGFATTTSRPLSRYEAFANIVVRRGAKPSDDPNAYDARAVLKALSGRIKPF